MLAYDKLTEEELLKHLGANDMEAAKYVYDKYAGAIYGIILQAAKLNPVSDEILYNTFVSFFNASCRNTSLIKERIFINLYVTAQRCVHEKSGLKISHKALNIPDRLYTFKPNQS